MKKIIALLLVAVMVLGMAACGTKAPAETTAASGNNPPAETTSSSGETTATTYPVIRFAYTKMFATPSEPQVEEAMNEILRETCGCEIDLVAIDFSNMQQQFNQKRTAIEKDMEDQVTGAVKSVASKKGLSLVVDKSAVIYGGTDITKDVSDTLNKSISASQSAAASQSK